jgi:cystathionine beta-lyase
MDFDTLTDRRAACANKWLLMEQFTGVTDADGLPMWVADMDFNSPDCAHRAAEDLVANSAYGYFDRTAAYHAAVAEWMQTRHGWTIDPDWILTAHGLGNGIAVLIQAFTDPGDGIVIFTPVYLEFATKIRKNRREVVESPLVIRDGIYHLDLDALDARMTGREKLMIISSPHNPAGRLWTVEEQKALAAFAVRHDLILVSDEIHQDLVFPGNTHVPMAVAAPEVADRLIMVSAASKTFNIAGLRVGYLIAPDTDLRATIANALAALDIKPNAFGVALTTAVYSDEGAAWVDALCPYLAANWQVFRDGMATIPGVVPMPMASTYLSWIDFAGTGLDMDEVKRRVTQVARVGPSFGAAFGTGGETFLRFNIGTQRLRVETAVTRLQEAFADL